MYLNSPVGVKLKVKADPVGTAWLKRKEKKRPGKVNQE